MKFYILFIVSLLSSVSCFAQNDGVKAVYQFSAIPSEKVLNSVPEEYHDQVYEQYEAMKAVHTLYYTKDKYAYSTEGKPLSNGRFTVRGANSMVIDLQTNRTISTRTLVDKSYIIEYAHKTHTWEIGKEQKVILGKRCSKATTNNGATIAWFSSDIPLPIGPLGYMGLPGMIMELETKAILVSLTEVSAADPKLEIVAPKEGTRISYEEYKKEEKALLSEGSEDEDDGEESSGVVVKTIMR